MKKRLIGFFAIFFIAILIFSSFVVAPPSWKQQCPINSNTNVVFYGETGFGGVGTPSRSWMIHFLDWWESYDPSINYVELSANNVKSNCNLSSFPNLKLYIQPGGDAYYQQDKLGSEGKNNILNYLSNNGAYFGACAGWYYAANDYYWQGEYYNHPNMLDIYPTVEGSITDIADFEGNTNHAVTSLSNGRNAIYYGGPTIGWRNTIPGSYVGVADSTFTAIPGNLPAVIKYNKTLLTSVHLEAFENDGITGLTTLDRIENYKYLANLLNEVAGTNFYVPPYTNPPVCGNNVKEIGEVCDGTDLNGESCSSQGYDSGALSCLSDCSSFDTSACYNLPDQCSDGVDNDGDSLVDYPADPGCDSSVDNDETDITGPVELLNDGFESGSLSGWNVYGSGSPWLVSTQDPRTGSYHAQSKQSGAGNPTYIEKSIDTTGYSSLTFEYYRKLIGLDAADDFSAEWYDGNSWNLLEHVSSQSNSNYVLRNYVLPVGAENNPNFKLRFMCEAGAVSEYCRIDDVKLISG